MRARKAKQDTKSTFPIASFTTSISNFLAVESAHLPSMMKGAAYGVAYAVVGEVKGAYTVVAIGKPFNDAYRYVDWLLTVPLLLLELVLVMGLPVDETRSLAWKLGVSSAVMVAFGYPGEISSDTTTRWIFWAIVMIPFLFVVGTLVVGLAPKKGKKGDKGDVDSQRLDTLLSAARYLTVFSWCTYPVIYCVKIFGVNSV